MIPFTLNDLARITGGTLGGTTDGDLVIDGPVVTDSREAAPGSLYVARIGEHADGHDFVGAARNRGAVASLVSKPVPDSPYLLVPDVQEAFAAIATAVIKGIDGLQVIGITGSSGKTSTKDVMAAVLQEHGSTVATIGSLNSEVGVPLTVCRALPQTQHLVLEMGARGVGHIQYLTDMTQPTIGVVLNVGSAHVGEFGGQEIIARAKAELVQALPADGLAVLNADDPLVAAMAGNTAAQVVLVGRGPQAQIRADDVQMTDAGTARFTLVTGTGRASVDLQVLGEHMVDNALAVAAVALHLGMDIQAVARALSAARLTSRWRLERHDRPDGVTVLNDAYNANPDSLAAALHTLIAMGRGRRTWAVVGEMLELGDDSRRAHYDCGALAASVGVDRVVAVGDGARAVADGASTTSGTPRVDVVPDVTAAHQLLTAELAPGDIVLLKSSRDSGLRLLGDALVDGEAPA
ncbi:UDP-N-acetylmuramoyl-tripeptide--D-alanyl-D-alanine ligase [Austwickia sp. TVS 96-490-7B]|uniref:UDP-N-acetylmuramoyl-tripeptide--D-alanyl-D- alanine ligase n=1 Tax=Austwickia sp. TVS 96-490-7B TaxID=2830843 RepID=UPI001C59D4A6|nr:UDP-N-acetylmuramoyl-tripeptide--D-alanyl-D-alanine ligase [Austwickia sp. TVS 96-490-7B]MBW3084407.1 UDP-N-acetylmuramoyl-tripeptide--D-alanyl-D-alanine ligase [Austwickia sp. TVS 96-490-7B]